MSEATDERNRPELRISAAALRGNVTAVRAQIAPSDLMLVVKDEAYGHGLETIVDHVDTAWIGSYDVATALRVRDRRAQTRVFAWATSPDDEVAAALEGDIDLGVGTLPYLRRIIDQAQRTARTARVHLKIDTGLHRNGVRPEEWGAFVTEARAAEAADVLDIVGVWSHLAEASDAEDDESAEVFAQAVADLRAAGSAPAHLHLTASAASWWRPELRGTLCRIGAFCYGIRSADGPVIPGTRPIATLVAPVLEVSGSRAVISIGAQHGLPSLLGGATVGTSHGPRTLGTVGALTSTIEGAERLQPGDDVHLFGPGRSGESDATTLAERMGTVGEELLTRLTPDVRRVHTL